MRQIVKFLFFKLLLPFVYGCAAPGKKRAAALFVRQRALKGPDNFAALKAELEKRGVPCREYCLENKERGYYASCLHMARLAARSRCLVAEDSVNAVLCLPFSKKQRLVQVWHACGAFKKWGYACLANRFGEDAKTLRRYYPHEKTDLVTVSAPAVIPFYEQAFHLEDHPGKVQALGTPRTDAYFDPEALASARSFLDREIAGAAGKKLLLYAPTFRGELETAAAPRLPDLNALSAALGADFLILVKQHPAVKNRPDVSFCPAAREVSDLPMEPLLMGVSMAVTDYSSWIFEYALQEKPLFFFAEDLLDYEDERGFFLPYEQMIPGRLCRNEQQLTEEISAALRQFDKAPLRAFRETYMSACDGQASKRVADFILRP